MRKRFALVAALLALATIVAVPASFADNIFVGVSTDGGTTITTAAQGTNQAGWVTSQTFGSFTINSITATGQAALAAPNVLYSNTVDTTSNAAGTLTIFVTETGVTSPAGPAAFFSGFTVNTLAAGWTVTESTFYDAADGGAYVYAAGNLLSSESFSTNGSVVDSSNQDLTGSSYTVVHRYDITANGAGSSNSTVNLSVPEPASMMLLSAGILGLGGFFRRRK